MIIKWWLKIAIKLVLSRIPVPNSYFRKLHIFRNGEMDNPEYAFTVVNKHFKSAKSWLDNGFTALELGPGDSLLSALILTSLGANKIYLIDTENFSSQSMSFYRKTLKLLKEKQYKIPNVNLNAISVDEFYQHINYEYCTKGLVSLQAIPDNSVDFIWSHSVLEHIRLQEFDLILKELHRILKPNGVCSHGVDLYDHFEESLNNLRFSEKLWECDFFVNSGFYTNRIRHDQMVDRFKVSGFKVFSDKTRKWKKLPIEKRKLSRPYRDYKAKNLRIHWFDIILTKNTSSN